MGIYICHMKIIGCLTILDGDFTFPPTREPPRMPWRGPFQARLRSRDVSPGRCVKHGAQNTWLLCLICMANGPKFHDVQKKTPADLMIHKYDWKLWIAQALMFSIMVSIRPSILESQWFDSYPWVDQPEKWASRTVNVRVSLKIYTIRSYIFWN